MAGYADTKKLIEDTLVGRPAGTMIYPEGHQAMAMSLLDYIHSVELLGASELQGIATTSTVPVQPDNAKVSYIATVPAGQTYVFTNFHDQNGNSISITTGANTISLLTFLWNGEYWQVQNNQIQLMLNITAGYLYAGIAVPTTNPGSPDEPVFYIAVQAGTYANFGGIVVNDGEAAILKYVNSSWVKEVSGLATREELSRLGQGVADMIFQHDDKLSATKLITQTWRKILPVHLIAGKSYKFNISTNNPVEYPIYLYLKSSDFIEGSNSGTTLVNLGLPANTTDINTIYTATETQDAFVVMLTTNVEVTVTVETMFTVKTDDLANQSVTFNKLANKVIEYGAGQVVHLVNKVIPATDVSDIFSIGGSFGKSVIIHITNLSSNLKDKAFTVVCNGSYSYIRNEGVHIISKDEDIIGLQLRLASGEELDSSISVDVYCNYSLDMINVVKDVVTESKSINIIGNGSSAVLDVMYVDDNTDYLLEIPEFVCANNYYSNNILDIRRGNDSTTIYQVRYDRKLTLPKYIRFNSANMGRILIYVLDDLDTQHVFRLIKNDADNISRNGFLVSMLEDEVTETEERVADNMTDWIEKCGMLCCKVRKEDMNDSTFIELFNSTQVSVGDRLQYKIRVDSRSVVNYNSYIELRDSNDTRLAIYGKLYVSWTAEVYSGQFLIPEGFSYAVFGGSAISTIEWITNDISNDNLKIEIETNKSTQDAAIANLQESISHISGVNNIVKINAVAFGATPIEILSNKDAGATAIDNGWVNEPYILKVSDSMYYLYYEGMPKDGPATDADQIMCMAYSTDGLTYTRGLPPGVEEIEPGTNIISRDIIGLDVKKVNDPTYPYRAVGLTTVNGEAYTLTLYRSVDAIHFEVVRHLYAGRDNTPNLIVRGNVLKIYTRTYGHGRTIGIVYCDLDGNILSPIVSAIDRGDNNEQYYLAAATAIDDYREILFPTIYNPTNSEERLTCLFVDHNRYDEINFTSSNAFLKGTNKSIYARQIVSIGTDQYLLHEVLDDDHEHLDRNHSTAKICLAKVSWYYGL